MDNEDAPVTGRACPRCGVPRAGLPEGALCGPCLVSATAPHLTAYEERISHALRPMNPIPMEAIRPTGMGLNTNPPPAGLPTFTQIYGSTVFEGEISTVPHNGFAAEYVQVVVDRATEAEEEEDEETSRSCVGCGVSISENADSPYCEFCAAEHSEEDEEDEENVDTRICMRCSTYFFPSPGARDYCPACVAAVRGLAPSASIPAPVPRAVRAPATIPRTEGQLDTMMNVPQSYQTQWEREGWSIFECCGLLEIEKDYSQNIFGSDAAAIDYVVSRAMGGSVVHMVALWFHGQPASVSSEDATVIPRQLLPQPGDLQNLHVDLVAGLSESIATRLESHIAHAPHYLYQTNDES